MSARGIGEKQVRALLGLAALMALAVAGCGRTPGSTRYQAERSLWRAEQLERRWALRPTRNDALLREVQAGYSEVLQKYPMSAVGQDPVEAPYLARLRAGAGTALARAYIQDGAPEKALGVLWNLRTDFPGSLEATLAVDAELIPMLARMERADTLAILLREMMQLAPATPQGQPIPLVLEAPLRLADLLARSNTATASGPALEEAYAYYDKVRQEHAGSACEVAALVQEANVRMRQNRPQEAEQLLEKARALPQAAPYEAGIVSSLATVAQRGLKDPLKAVDLLRESLRLQPDEVAAGQVLLRIGLAFVEAGRQDSALAALAQAESHAGSDPNLAAQARFISAKVLMGAKQTSEGLRRLRSVTADYPRTEAGLQAPLEIVAYYREAGDKAATAATLREAEGEYDRLIKELSGAQGQEGVIMAALDRLANVRVGMEDWAGAADVLARRADGFPGDAGSPLALVQAAAIRETRLQDRQGSIALLQKMVERYPQHPLTPQVKDKIAQMGAGS